MKQRNTTGNNDNNAAEQWKETFSAPGSNNGTDEDDYDDSGDNDNQRTRGRQSMEMDEEPVQRRNEQEGRSSSEKNKRESKFRAHRVGEVAPLTAPRDTVGQAGTGTAKNVKTSSCEGETFDDTYRPQAVGAVGGEEEKREEADTEGQPGRGARPDTGVGSGHHHVHHTKVH